MHLTTNTNYIKPDTMKNPRGLEKYTLNKTNYWENKEALKGDIAGGVYLTDGSILGSSSL